MIGQKKQTESIKKHVKKNQWKKKGKIRKSKRK